jgi:glucose/arabinose dehydrogenase
MATMMNTRRRQHGLLLVLAAALTLSAAAQTIPDIQLLPVATGFQQPLQVVSARDGSGRLFVVEQAGVIRVMDTTGAGQHGAFLSIKERITAGGEMGLLGLAFHPDFQGNRRFFVNYTTKRRDKLYTHISEFTARPDRSAGLPLSEQVLLRFLQPFPNHNGGHVLFGPDGYLYIGTGDGGSANDPYNNGQKLDTYLGKILRIDVNRAARRRYAIPADNPFVQATGVRPEIYAYGLRNPWRFSFDRESGLLFCGDVGQNAREEIDVILKGGNYGWRVMEGTICTPGVDPTCDGSGYAPPIIDYGRDQGISVTGGYVYRGAAHPELRGVYLYGDYGSGKVWGLRYFNGQVIAHRELLDTNLRISSFGEDDQGEVLVVDHAGTIYRVGKP